tara:strand:- start:5308 stop:5892 length:585 start_codon:yes stop_codon:yes gene_type:complete
MIYTFPLQQNTFLFPLAFCQELDKIVSPWEILHRKQQNPSPSLTFSCPACKHSLLFSAQKKGGDLKAGFLLDTNPSLSHKKTDHQNCLQKIKPFLELYDDFWNWHQFEEKLGLVENLTKDLFEKLLYLDKAFYDLVNDIERLSCLQKDPSSSEGLLATLTETFNQLHTPFSTFENFLRHITTTYTSLRKQTKGF